MKGRMVGFISIFYNARVDFPHLLHRTPLWSYLHERVHVFTLIFSVSGEEDKLIYFYLSSLKMYAVKSTYDL